MPFFPGEASGCPKTMRWAEISDCSDYDNDFDSSPDQSASYSDVIRPGSPTQDPSGPVGPSTLPDAHVVA